MLVFSVVELCVRNSQVDNMGMTKLSMSGTDRIRVPVSFDIWDEHVRDSEAWR